MSDTRMHLSAETEDGHTTSLGSFVDVREAEDALIKHDWRGEQYVLRQGDEEYVYMGAGNGTSLYGSWDRCD